MKKEQIQENGISRRGFLKRTALAGAAICIAPALEKVTAAEKAITGKSSVSAATIPAGMAAVRAQRTLGSGKAAFTISAMGFGCMGLNHHRSQSPVQVKTEEDSTPTNIRRVCENAVRNLGVETLGIFYQHRVDPATPIEVVAETCGELIREGKILHWGMCEVNAETIRRAHKVCPVTAIQSEYHFMHRAVEENGVLALCEELGIGFVPYSPLNRGFLGGMINEYTRFDTANDNRQTLPRFQPEAIRANTRIVEVLNAFGRTRGITTAQVALAWLLNRRPFIVPIPGTTKLSHLEENLRACDIVFTSEEMTELEKAVAAIPVVGSRYDALQESKIQK